MMNRLAIASLCSVIATARDQREHATLAQLMMLHDEMVQHLDQETNEADANLFDRLFGGGDDKKTDKKQEPKAPDAQEKASPEAQDREQKKLQPRYEQTSPDEKYTKD